MKRGGKAKTRPELDRECRYSMNLGWILLFLLIGLAMGYGKIIPRNWRPLIAVSINLALAILLGAMGAQIGGDRELWGQLDKIGLQALALAAASIAGSLLFLQFISPRRKWMQAGPPGFKVGDGRGRGFLMVFVVASLVGGFGLGIIIPPTWISYLDQLIVYALSLLLWGIGLDLGFNPHIFKSLGRLGWRIILLPFLIAMGSIVGSIIAGYTLGIAGNQAAAVGAGFGWYSLSGVLLTGLHSVELGTLAFLSNVFREVLAILSLPLVAKYLGSLTAIAPGGATAMDVTLPLIKKVAGEEVVLPAFFSGAMLSAMVPVLVPLFISLDTIFAGF